MSASGYKLLLHGADTAPGDDSTEHPETDNPWQLLVIYLIGFALAAGLTVVSFFITRSGLVWQPSIPVALSVLAVAQMGVHLIFFLHLTSGEESVNNIMALAFGVMIVMLVVLGSLWIMSHLNDNMLPMSRIMQMQR